MPQNNPDYDGADINRRSMLKAVGVSAAASMVVAGNASAHPKQAPEAVEQAQKEFADPATAREAVANHAEALLSELQSQGVLATGSVSELSLGEVVSPNEYEVTSDGAMVLGIEAEGQATAEITASAVTDTHEVEVAVQPQRDYSYALVNPKDGGDMYKLVSDGNADLSTQDHCHYEYSCDPFSCPDGGGCYGQKRHCCDSNGDGSEDDCNSWSYYGCCTC